MAGGLFRNTPTTIPSSKTCVIKPIYNFSERVWFDVGSQRRDRSDSRHCFVLQAVPTEDYKEKFPKGSKMGISTERTKSAYYNKASTITIGQIYYVKFEDAGTWAAE
jgi:hypothetical protein